AKRGGARRRRSRVPWPPPSWRPAEIVRIRELLGAVGGALRPALTAARRRRAWADGGYAFIDVPAIDVSADCDADRAQVLEADRAQVLEADRAQVLEADRAQVLEQAVQAVDGVDWATWNGVLGQVLVGFDPARVGLDDLVGVVDRTAAEWGDGRSADPG